MIDVVFDSSVKGSLKHAMNYNPDSWKKGPIAFVGKKLSDEELEIKFAGKPIEKKSSMVVQLGFFLDMDGFGQGLFGQNRKDLFSRLYNIVPDRENENRKMIEALEDDFQRLKEGIEKGISIRVFVDHSPNSVCGYYYLCDLLAFSDCSLSKVLMPSYFIKGKHMCKGGWNSVSPGKFYQLLPNEQRVPPMEIRDKSKRWQELVKENGPLRAIVNGNLVSVPLEFYDHFIQNALSNTPISMGKLLARIMMTYDLGISDGWLRFRVESMIQSGSIAVIGYQDDIHPYGAILKKLN